MRHAYWVNLRSPRATFGLEVEEGVVVHAPPIARYALGWSEAKALKYFAMRGTIVAI